LSGRFDRRSNFDWRPALLLLPLLWWWWPCDRHASWALLLLVLAVLAVTQLLLDQLLPQLQRLLLQQPFWSPA
jgi:hypothetical protein